MKSKSASKDISIKRSRLFPLLAVLLVLASLVSTETAEVWCRVAVGATLDADDDDSLYFQGQGRTTTVSEAMLARALLSAAPIDCSLVDEPTFNLPQLILVAGPLWTPHISIASETVAYAPETRSAAVKLIRFVRPPPRAPPIS